MFSAHTGFGATVGRMDRRTAIAVADEVAAGAPAAQREGDARFTVSRLERLLARRRRLAELGLCGPGSPCAWHRKLFDRAIVSYLLAAEEMGLVIRSSGLLVVRAGRAGARAA